MNKLEIFRAWMRKKGVAGFIVPSGDNHFNEYTQEYSSCRRWLSGFSGSAGTVVITVHRAALWTDSRYFAQAAEQLEGSGIELMKMKVIGTPSITEWLTSVLPVGAKVGVDAELFSVSEFNALKSGFSSIALVVSEDPFAEVWSGRAPIQFGKIRRMSEDISGMRIKEKVALIKERLGIEEGRRFAYILSTCDDIAWLCNIRGADIFYNPLALSFASVTDKGIVLFVGDGAVDEELKEELGKEGVMLKGYYELESYIMELDKDAVIYMCCSKMSFKYYDIAVKAGREIVTDNIPGGVVASLKAVKNRVEIEGFEKAMLMDGVAWVKLWMYIEKGLASGVFLTESGLSEAMIAFRSECKDYLGESFSPIVAYGKNGAMPHYSSQGKADVIIKPNSFLLIDSGAQYMYGTTDTTRTFALGNINAEQIRDYTSVLKGMISLSMAIFPKGTKGSALDMFARGAVCAAGKLYLHGTGHGVGHNLCVHEGPQSIRMEDNPVEFTPGMVTSNEPAIYVDGEYGIRIENLILCVPKESNVYGEFYGFKTMTYIPIDKSIIDKELLGSNHLDWLNRYHAEVYSKLSPFLNTEEKAWLANKCSELC